MMKRCYQKNMRNYESYGGRGIRVCKRWHAFEKFYADMGVKPSPKHSLERKNNNAGYSPQNCIWATATQQNRNRRNVKKYKAFGKTLTLPEWAEESGIKCGTIAARIIRYGFTVEEALTRQLRHGSLTKMARSQ